MYKIISANERAPLGSLGYFPIEKEGFLKILYSNMVGKLFISLSRYCIHRRIYI